MECLDLVEILAHLDFLVEGPRSKALPDKDAEKHIQRVLVDLAAKLGNRYAVAHIRDLLWQTIRRGYKYPEFNFPQLFLHGSSEIKDLDLETRKLVEERLAVIHLDTALHAPRSRRSRSVFPTPTVTPSVNRRTTSTLISSSTKSYKRNQQTKPVRKYSSRKKASLKV